MKLAKDIEKHWRRLLWICLNHRRPIEDAKPLTADEVKDLLRENSRDLESLWLAYNQNRENLGRIQATSARILMPYLLGFHLGNAYRTAGTLERMSLFKHKAFWTQARSVYIVDLGCGTGAVGLTWLMHFKKSFPEFQNLHYWAVDRSQYFAELAAKSAQLHDTQAHCLARKWDLSQASSLRQLAAELSSLPAGSKVILTAGYLLNELQGRGRAAEELIRFFMDFLSSPVHGLLHLMEPAEESHARRTLKLRDQFVDEKISVLYPCPTGSGACPLSTKDWCYSEFESEFPREIEDLHRRLLVKRQRLGAASYVFVGQSLAERFQSERQAVWIGRPRTKTGAPLKLKCTGEKIERIATSFKDISLRGESV